MGARAGRAGGGGGNESKLPYAAEAKALTAGNSRERGGLESAAVRGGGVGRGIPDTLAASALKGTYQYVRATAGP